MHNAGLAAGNACIRHLLDCCTTMIVRPRPSGIEYFFLLRGSVLPTIWLKLTITIVTAIVVAFNHGVLYHLKISLTPIPFSLMGLALAIFLGFRNSASYDRFWEGRKLWGGLTNASRNLVRQACAYLEAPAGSASTEQAAVEQMRSKLAYAAIAFGHSLRHQLRDEDPWEDIARLLPAEQVAGLRRLQNPAARILHAMGQDIQSCQRRGWLSLQMAQEMDRSVEQMVAVLGGCERLKHTPLPFSYSVLLHRTVYVYCYLLPFGLIDSIGMLTPLVVGVVSYTFFGLDAIGDEIEEPFGLTSNDLPLTALSYGVEISVRELLGETDLPPQPQPVDYFLQ